MKRLAVSPYGGGGSIAPFNRLFQAHYNPCAQNNLKGAAGLLLWGGTDIHPSFYNQLDHPKTEVKAAGEISQRDLMEWHMMREAFELGIPIIGVCRGAQFLTVFAGGSLIQDVTGHEAGHDVETHAGKTYYAPANHHQMMCLKDITDYQLLGWSPKRSTHYQDGLMNEVDTGLEVDPEVVYFPSIKGFAIQPHPEWGPAGTEFNNWIIEEIREIL